MNTIKSRPVYILFLMLAFSTSCGQNQTAVPQENIKSETKDTGPSYRSNDPNIHTTYEYTDSIGKSLVIQNGFPKSNIHYTDPGGKKYTYAIFWTRIINEAFDTLKVTIDFPLDSFEFSSSSGRFMKLLLPSDTMTIDKEPLFDYGLNLKSFLDNYRYKPSSLKRTIHPKESSGFYIVMLGSTVEGAQGSMLRTGLSLKRQDLFYRISRYTSMSPISLIDEKEIHCGSSNLKNLMVRK